MASPFQPRQTSTAPSTVVPAYRESRRRSGIGYPLGRVPVALRRHREDRPRLRTASEYVEITVETLDRRQWDGPADPDLSTDGRPRDQSNWAED